jgi:dipeptidase
MKNNTILGTSNVLKQIDPKTVNQKTAYWLGRNVRILEPTIEKFETLRKDVTKDSWFAKYQEASKEDKEGADKTYKDQLTEADNELKAFLDTETDIKIYKINIDDLNIASDLIPYLLDFITDSQQG